ncbi:MAG: C25 family cysteine peptidase [Bacteroidota bacterium]
MRHILIVILFMGCFQPMALFAMDREPSVKLGTSVINGFTRLDPEGDGFSFCAAVDVIHLEPAGGNPSLVLLTIPGYYSVGKEGSPSLPRYTILFEAGPRDVLIRVEQMDSMIFDLNLAGFDGSLIPFQDPGRKGVPEGPVKRDSAVYSTDAWVGDAVVSVEYEGTMRGLSMSTLHFNPVKYNPVQNLLKVYYNVRYTIGTGRLVQPAVMPEQAFSALFSRVVRRESQSMYKAVYSEEPMTFVILSDTMFRETIIPLVEWKTRKGFRVVEVYRTDSLVGGTRESIKAYLKSLYDHPPLGVARPTYLLIVGDTEHIPVSQAGGEVTDLYYAAYDGGGDYIPELFYGRISVNSTGQLQEVLNKILEYEQYLFPDPSFLDQAVLIAGVDASYAGTYGNGQINYASDYYLNEEQGNTTHMFRYPESDTSARAILDLISGGVGFVNYTGHGEVDRWKDPGFRISDIDQLHNVGKYPVMIGNGCETNYFLATECLAEALLRAPEKGALAYIGCTNDSYWDEDYYWAVGVGPVQSHPAYEGTGPGYYDKVFHTHREDRSLWTPSLGEMVFGGNMAVQQSSSHRKKFYWEIYQLAGDPSIVPWFIQPAIQEPVLPPWLPPGSGRVDVRCAPYSYLAISKDGILLDALHASGEGYATLFVPDTLATGSLDLVVSGDRFSPFMKEIEMAVQEGPYLDLLGYSLTSESVDGDGFLNPGEQAALDLQLINRGNFTIQRDSLVLFSEHPSMMIMDSIHILEGIEPGDTLDLQHVFLLKSDDRLIDQNRAMMGIRSHGGGPFYLKVVLHAPQLTSKGIWWDDRPLGNGNGIAEMGEKLLCKWHLANTGHFKTGNVQGSFIPERSFLAEDVVFYNQPVLNPGDSAVLQFGIKVSGRGKGWFGAGSLSAGDPSGTVKDSMFIATDRYFDDFSQGNNGLFLYRDNSRVPWVLVDDCHVSPSKSIRSGRISHGEESDISVHFETTEDDTLSFSYRVSSESYYDFLMFFADSNLIEKWSGETGWNRYSLFLEAGMHEMVWSYRKDNNTSHSEDAAWIDDILYPVSAFRNGDLAFMEITEPESGPWLTDHEQVKVRVRNTSKDTIPGFIAHYSLDGAANHDLRYEGILLPGHDAEITAGEKFDFSGFGSHLLEFEVVSDTMGYPGNNKLEKVVDHIVFPDLSLAPEKLDQLNGLFAHAVVKAVNTGNIPLDSMRFEIWINDLLVRSGIRVLDLEPGDQTEIIFNIADSLDHLPPGFYGYLIKAMDPDCLAWTSQVEGLLSWFGLGLNSGATRADWSIYPNPVRSAFRVNLSQPAGQDYLFELVSPVGRVVDSFVIPRGDYQRWIQVRSAAPGTYVLRLFQTGETIRLVILP